MVSLLWVVSILQAIAGSQCYLKLTYSASAGPIKSSSARDAGERLFLTPYIRSGRAAEGRRAAHVRLPGPALESYAGFFTVDDTHNSNHFLWYFPPVAADAATAPVLVWLQGGPGGSSLFGLFMENGPLEFINGSFTLRKHHWALNHHVLYIDNPVGAGFSFTDSKEGYCHNETRVGEHLYSTLTQFFQLFPGLQPNKFFITGESYAGKYIPALAYTIHKKNPTAKTKINLQGLAIGNGWCDPEHQLVYSKHLYQTGFIDWGTKNITEMLEAKAINSIKNRKWNDAFDSWSHILGQVASGVNIYNYSPFSKTLDEYDNTMAMIIKSEGFRKAIHVGQQLFDDQNTLGDDMLQSVAPWISELLDHYRVVFYNGQYDIIVAYPLTINFVQNLRFSGSEEYERGWPRLWRVHTTTQGGPCMYETAGLWKSGGNLTTVLVRGAGHMVPAERPAWAHDLITKVTHGGF